LCRGGGKANNGGEDQASLAGVSKWTITEHGVILLHAFRGATAATATAS
jgi:hypothetical protein